MPLPPTDPAIPLSLGEVVRIAKSPHLHRVVAFDAIEVFITYWYEELGRWLNDDPRVQNILGRQPTDHFLDSITERVRLQPLSGEEAGLFRPDLPLRLYRHRGFGWSREIHADRESFAQALAAAGIDAGSLPDLAAPKIALRASTARRALKPPRIVRSWGDGNLTALEILWRAHELQAPWCRQPTTGIGFYRSGWVGGGTPSYLIGSYHDFCGATQRWEDRRGAMP